jgi:hypothetical protein
MPPGFDHPILWGTVDFWQPLAFNAEQKKSRGTNFLSSFARLKPGISIEQAQQSMVTLAANIGKENDANSGESLRLEPLQRSMSDDIGRKVMWFTFGLAGFVLLIACANLANLQLVRTASRSRELAVRAALGAGRLRLIRQSLTESLLVALIGGTFSLVLALFGARFISKYLFADLPGANIGLDQSFRLCSSLFVADGIAIWGCAGIARLACRHQPGVTRKFARIDSESLAASIAAHANNRRSCVRDGFARSGRFVLTRLTEIPELRSRLAY